MEHSTSRKSKMKSADAPPSYQDLEGETFDDFHILRLLGQGGMGRVYLAEQISLKRKVAIKVLRPDLAITPTALTRFRAESKTIALLNHTNVVQAYTVGEYDGHHYLVLEYVDGVSLRRYLAKKGPLEASLALSVMRQVASALHRASELDIIHRDIKPENILLTRKAEAKVADFGLARCLTLDEPIDLTRSGTAVGTPRYMSPEQVEGKPIDQRTDIYSFGVTSYEMLTGQRPFDGTNAFEIALKHVREEPAPLESLCPALPPQLCAIVRKMMAKNPEARYSSARALLKDLARARESLGNTVTSLPALSVTSETPAVVAPRGKGWLRWGLALGAAAVLLAGAAAGWSFWGTGTAAVPSPTPPAIPSADASKERDEAKKEEAAKKERDDVARKEREEAVKKEEALTQAVEQVLKDSGPNPGGVDTCIELGVFYLEEERVRDAELLFRRMSERNPPSAYHFVGRLGLAVTDSVQDNDKSAQTRFKELFDPKSKDNRARILNDYLKRNVKFEEWVNEADVHDVRRGAASTPRTKTPPRFPFGKLKLRRP